MAKLSKRIAETTPHDPARDVFIRDSETRGFFLRITPGNARSFGVRFRDHDQKLHNVGLGKFGIITVDQARQMAKQILVERVPPDRTPTPSRRSRKAGITIAELCERYMTAAHAGLVLGRAGLPKRVSTLDSDRGRIDGHVTPLIGDIPVVALKRHMIIEMMNSIIIRGTARQAVGNRLRGKRIVRGGPGVAARTVGMLGAILGYAVDIGLIETSPCMRIRKPAAQKRDRRLSPDEYRRWWAGIIAAEDAGASRTGVLMVKLLVLTGWRSSEVEGLRWAEIDRVHQRAILVQSKTGRSVRPLSDAAMALLNHIDDTHGYGLVFPGKLREELPYAGLRNVWREVAAQSGIVDISPHTLRHSFASVAADADLNESRIAALLGHKPRSTTAGYVHPEDSRMILAANKVAGIILSHCGSDVMDDHHFAMPLQSAPCQN